MIRPLPNPLLNVFQVPPRPQFSYHKLFAALPAIFRETRTPMISQGVFFERRAKSSEKRLRVVTTRNNIGKAFNPLNPSSYPQFNALLLAFSGRSKLDVERSSRRGKENRKIHRAFAIRLRQYRGLTTSKISKFLFQFVMPVKTNARRLP